MLNRTEVPAEGRWEVFAAEDTMVVRKQKTQVQGWCPGSWVPEPRLKYFLPLFIPQRTDHFSELLNQYLNDSHILLYYDHAIHEQNTLFLLTFHLVGSAPPCPVGENTMDLCFSRGPKSYRALDIFCLPIQTPFHFSLLLARGGQPMWVALSFGFGLDLINGKH